MRTIGRRLQLWFAIAIGLGVVVSGTAWAGDVKDILVDVVRPVSGSTITSPFDCVFRGLCNLPSANFDSLLEADSGALAPLELDSLASVTSGVVNDRIVPLSSSVSGFTYDYNPDLDVYDRSTKTFGPLFSERAQTIGKKRFLVGLSQSYLEFDQYNGDNLDSITLSELGGQLPLGESGAEFDGVTLISQLNEREQGNLLDVDLDLNIKEWVSTGYFTYGLTERIDVGIVVPLMRIKAKASARALESDSELLRCDDPSLDLLGDTPCFGTNVVSSNSKTENHTGIGDLVVRGKWNYYVGVVNAAFTAEATIPTGDPDNLTGLHTMTYRPGMVVSKDFETPIGGLGLQAYAGYNFRPDIPDEQEFDWAVGGALQPFGRASISFDLIGSNETRGQENFLLDGSVGLKLMLAQNVLVDFNWIAPLNDDGLRPSAGIFTFQIEGTFGD
ncbi:MAG: transporter [Myxococcota bacterium]